MAPAKKGLSALAAAAFALLCLASCASTQKQEVVEIPQPMAWPASPVLPCRARVAYAQEFLGLSNQGLPEQRIVIADDWEPAQERDEILEIRRRAYHDREALQEVLACAAGKET